MANLNIKFNNKSYSIDSTSLADTTARLEAHLASMAEEPLEGTGAEYYTLAPTALSFRSTEPLAEFQEIQVNGQTVDPANYTLEEGSTIVKLSVDYLKTLEKGNYEVAVVSENKTVKGSFTVAAPELNEHGFYYNQPYVGQVQGYGNVALFYRESGVLDFIITDTGYIETATYTVSGNAITNNVSLGAIPATISNSDEIQCAALGATFKLGDTSIAADADYMYVYKEDLGGYEVRCIDKTKAEYGAIKTGINGIDTVKLADDMFAIYTNGGDYEINQYLISMPQIPNSVTSIGYRAFYFCTSLKSVVIPDSVEHIGDEAFFCCESLTSVVIPDSVTSIGDSTFHGCKNLTSVIIPNSVTSIGYRAFYDCDSLTSVVIPDSVEHIGDEAFAHCSNLTSVEIPDSVTSIGDGAFYNCNSLTSVEIGDSVTSIGERAFYNCNSLTSIVIPNSVASIGEDVFYHCTELANITFEGTIAQWNTVTKGSNWSFNVPATYVQCSDGQVAL